MTKCDFCEQSSPSGKCYWSTQVSREYDCEKAIKRMIKALQGAESNNKRKWL